MTSIAKVKASFSRQKTGYIPTLDGWRAIAIFGVMLFHGGPLLTRYPLFAKFQAIGANGVELFFAISGILICSRLLDEEDAWGKFSLRGFYIRRLFRIQPAAFVFLLVVALLAIAGTIPFSKTGWLTALFSVRNLYQSHNPADGAVYTAHYWSLALEEHFYLVLPFLLILLRGKRRILWFTLLTFASILVYEYMARAGAARGPWRSELELAWLFFPAWIALLIRRPHLRERFTKFLPVAPTLLVVAVIGIGTALHWKFIQLLWLPSFSLLILSTVLHPNSFAGRFLELSPFRMIGRISYSLYLWQQLFCISLEEYPSANAPLRWMQHHPQSYIFPFACAFLSYYIVEKPFIRLGHKLAPPLTPGHKDLDTAPTAVAGIAEPA